MKSGRAKVIDQSRNRFSSSDHVSEGEGNARIDIERVGDPAERKGEQLIKNKGSNTRTMQ